MHKLESGSVRFNANLTIDIMKNLQQEANETHKGNISRLMREILTKRYKSKKIFHKHS